MTKRLKKSEFMMAYMIIITLACTVGGFFCGAHYMKTSIEAEQAAAMEAKQKEAEKEKMLREQKLYSEQDFIRFYYAVLPIEVALTLGGVVLFAVAYLSIKKLKEKESGLTFKPDRINHSDAILNAEALVVASTFGMKPEVKPQASPMVFGGGGFSGGGSDGSF